jgi:hypothetical protein
MIVKIEAEIIGSFLIEQDMMVKHQPYEITIRFEQDSARFLISISKRELNYSAYIPKIKADNKKSKRIEIPPEDFFQEQIKILQHLESFGAIDKNIERIDWQNCLIEWIPENEEEGIFLNLRKYQRKLNYDLNKTTLSKDWLFNTIIHRKQLENLVLPFAFFREGANFFHKFQYQNAFINFYLMLEGVFSNGLYWKNKIIENDFKKSDIMNTSILQSINYLQQIGGKHYNWLNQICKAYNKNVDIEGVIHILIEQRGCLSHFSLASPNNQKDPFADRDYESLAYLTMIICRNASIKLRLEPFKKK